MNDIIDKMRKLKGTTDIDITNYLLNYQGDYTNLKIDDVANSVFRNKTAITRYAQKIGLSGFPELKYYLHITNNTQKKEEVIIYNNYLNSLFSSLNETFANINYEDIILASTCIRNTNKIVLTSLGMSSVVANDFHYKLLRFEKNVFFNFDPDMQIVNARSTNRRDVILGISYSGKTSNVIKSLNIGKEKEAITILITANKQLVNDYDFVFLINSSDDNLLGFSVQSRSSMQLILDMIHHELYYSNPKYQELLYNNKIFK